VTFYRAPGIARALRPSTISVAAFDPVGGLKSSINGFAVETNADPKSAPRPFFRI
jgi:hypothetical protein